MSCARASPIRKRSLGDVVVDQSGSWQGLSRSYVYGDVGGSVRCGKGVMGRPSEQVQRCCVTFSMKMVASSRTALDSTLLTSSAFDHALAALCLWTPVSCAAVALLFFTIFLIPLSSTLFSHLAIIRPSLDMRRDVQDIFRSTPHHKQVMMFSATLAKEIRATCKKFMANVSGDLQSVSPSAHSAAFVL